MQSMHIMHFMQLMQIMQSYKTMHIMQTMQTMQNMQVMQIMQGYKTMHFMQNMQTLPDPVLHTAWNAGRMKHQTPEVCTSGAGRLVGWLWFSLSRYTGRSTPLCRTARGTRSKAGAASEYSSSGRSCSPIKSRTASPAD